MTSRNLLCALADYLRAALTGYPFPAPGGTYVDARVFVHGLPEGQEDAAYPFVVLRWLDGKVWQAEDGGTLLTDTVALAVGIHSPNSQEQAGLLLAELLDALRRALWTCRLLDGRFELDGEIRAATPEPKRTWHEYHMATVETSWTYVWPQRGLQGVHPANPL